MPFNKNTFWKTKKFTHLQQTPLITWWRMKSSNQLPRPQLGGRTEALQIESPLLRRPCRQWWSAFLSICLIPSLLSLKQTRSTEHVDWSNQYFAPLCQTPLPAARQLSSTFRHMAMPSYVIARLPGMKTPSCTVPSLLQLRSFKGMVAPTWPATRAHCLL